MRTCCDDRLNPACNNGESTYPDADLPSMRPARGALSGERVDPPEVQVGPVEYIEGATIADERWPVKCHG